MLFLDFLLLTMIIICVVYCWMLNRRIQDLQNSRVEFARMIKELNVSIIKAENNVNEMSDLSKITSAEIRSVVDEAKSSIKELTAISEIGSELLYSLTNKIRTINTQISSYEEENFSNNFESNKPNAGERFSEEDFAPIEEENNSYSYTNHLKNFIQTIVNKKPEEFGNKLNQTSYYETLRKINAKK